MRALRPMTGTEPEFEVNVKNNYVDCVDLPNARTRQLLPPPAPSVGGGGHSESFGTGRGQYGSPESR
ncbi:hypothetical protein GCM10027290_62630 [Micromonospora sonneratiae]|uniref:Uncharacterized protein n=1 Tax=Micromonospora sonneratiae TaxID=1184706 RepID=A0ABW3YFN0_9ACTN